MRSPGLYSWIRQIVRPAWRVLALMAGLIVASPAYALIEGGAGNDPLSDPGWPTGAAEVFNTPHRVAYWVGPPFGGGQYHADCRGNTEAFNEILEKFAAIKTKKKRLIVHNGEGNSFWLNTNRSEEKKAAAVIDWVFMVWQPESWKRLQQMPARFRAPDVYKDDEPVPQIDVYTNGRIIWADVVVPEGIEVHDERLEAHGFKVTDGNVIEGTILRLSDGAKIPGKAVIESIEPQRKGGYEYKVVSEVASDKDGHWVAKKVPAGSMRVIVSADGMAPRIAGHDQLTDEPQWRSHETKLVAPAIAEGKVTDGDGKPLADVSVRIDGITAGDGNTYDSTLPTEMKTAADGKFRFAALPTGKGQVWVHKAGYVRPGLGPEFQLPQNEIVLKMVKASTIKVTVASKLRRLAQDYSVKLTPEGGDVVGSWGGSGNVDPEGVMTFKDVPPGKYEITGRPNPGGDNQQSKAIPIDLKGGETLELEIKAPE
jgi:hypothetical protein